MPNYQNQNVDLDELAAHIVDQMSGDELAEAALLLTKARLMKMNESQLQQKIEESGFDLLLME